MASDSNNLSTLILLARFLKRKPDAQEQARTFVDDLSSEWARKLADKMIAVSDEESSSKAEQEADPDLQAVRRLAGVDAG
jgi:hypothetical protein